jgi:serine/threonine protein kinase
MSGPSDNWFSKVFRKNSQLEPKQEQVAAPKQPPLQVSSRTTLYKKGDLIGQKYKVFGILGMGGFGVVYKIYSQELSRVFALKTFRDEYQANQEVKKRFYKEASVWVELGSHPYLVNANHVEEISGRLFILMEFIAPNEEGLNTLEGFLQRRPPDLVQSLRWAIQICQGMEYAYSKGIRAHRDLKPANIMISQDGTARITDFGLAGVVSELPAMQFASLDGLSGQTIPGSGFGTPAYMAPEQFDNAAGCDERSDIYSFGVILFQMASAGRLPFPIPRDADWQMMKRMQCEAPVPLLNSPLFPVIKRCLEKRPELRYQTFKEVRDFLEPLLLGQTGEAVVHPQMADLGIVEWTNKGKSLSSLGRFEESLDCYEKALELDPGCVEAWYNKAVLLDKPGQWQKAVNSYERFIALSDRQIYANQIKHTRERLRELGNEKAAAEKDEIHKILMLHAKYLRGEEGGSKINLPGYHFGKMDIHASVMTGANLAGAHLGNITNLGGSNLAKADLEGADLGGINLHVCDLSNANMRNARLVRTNLFKSILKGADLSGADLTGATLTFAELEGAIFTGATMPDGKIHDPKIHSLESLTRQPESNGPIELFTAD